ncbi:hypothetical protein COLO4_34363 [Corchorus olitorius]|uniref:Uncharacterized protein n=1 Tax=Corchorus olitorius TaxID=93759 RepID=A0A1R3GL92_9ROSI|nr:hypothetical protein COLO4_34363 [Corchorus olitorius]
MRFLSHVICEVGPLEMLMWHFYSYRMPPPVLPLPLIFALDAACSYLTISLSETLLN